MANLDFLKFDPSKDQRKPFSMTDYESIPPEMRNDYVKTTSIPAKPQVSEEMIVEGDLARKQKTEELKKIFTPSSQKQTEIAPQAVQKPPAHAPIVPPTASYDAVSNTAAPQDITRQATEMMPKSGWADWLPALAPLITEAFMGGNGDSAGESLAISGDYLVGQEKDKLKRRQTIEDKLLDIQKSRAISGAKAAKSGNFLPVNIVDPETQMVIKANYDKNTGIYTTPDGKRLDSAKIQAGYSVIPTEFDRRTDVKSEASKMLKDYTPRVNPETGLPSRIVDGELQAIGTQNGKMNPQQEKELDQQIAKFITTDVYKTNAKSLQSASTIEGLIQDALSGNAAAANIARSEIAKIAEGGGRLTDQDVDRVGGPQDYRSKVQRFKNLQRTGRPLLDSDIADLREVVKTIEAASRLKLEEAMGDMEGAILQKGGVKGTAAIGMAPYIPKSQSSTPKFPMQLRKGNKTATISNQKELQEARSEGWN